MSTRPESGAPDAPGPGLPEVPGPQPEARVPDPLLTAPDQANRVAADVPYGLTVAAAWSWRVLLVLAMAGAGIWLLSHVSLLVIPLIVAALLSTLLSPIHQRLVAWGIPRGLSVTGVILGFIVLILGLLTLVGQQLAVGFTDMRDQIVVGVQGIVVWLESFGVTTDQWNDILSDLGEAVRANSQTILSGALGFGSTAGNIAAGTVLAVFALIFFLYDGKRIWRFCLNFVPARHRNAINGAGDVGWTSLGSYVRVQIFVAFVDALGIGLGALILGVPLALPLGVLVFFGSFIPLVGAFLTGAVAVLLALVANGWVNALIMLGVVLLVQQIEGNVLQPLVMGRAVSLHPLAVFLAVAGGTAVMGLVGAIFAVPLMAFLNATIKYFHAKPWLEDEPEPAAASDYRDTRLKERAAGLKDRAAGLEGPWGRAYVTIDGVVRRATSGAGGSGKSGDDGDDGAGGVSGSPGGGAPSAAKSALSARRRRQARRQLKRTQSRSRFLPRRFRKDRAAGADTDSDTDSDTDPDASPGASASASPHASLDAGPGAGLGGGPEADTGANADPGSGTSGNLRGSGSAGEENTGMDHSGRRPDRNGGPQ
ncbi:AI-2E family transporter [Citricoccus nitrophenolicus]|uniref:Putative PurR-regulated permease PerM n=1 Tax=Citricoccus muralis TaxID=169134 RepID=A0A3D9L7J1_9MICC|nr:AI-2E family transporter [Citricoccus muralis]REE02321.1 putative PurR-regulated permease PerM [Citricoccus muralis]